MKDQSQNLWLTPEQLMDRFQLSKPTFDEWRTECEASDYRDAIIRPTVRKTFIDLQLWKDFLVWKSHKTKDSLIDPHFRKES